MHRKFRNSIKQIGSTDRLGIPRSTSSTVQSNTMMLNMPKRIIAIVVAITLVFACVPCMMTPNNAYADSTKSTNKTKSELIATVNKASGNKKLKAIGGSYNFNSKAGKQLKSAIKSLKKYKLSFVMIDIKTGKGISYSPNKVQYIASSIKGPYVAAANKYHPNKVTSKWKKTMSSTIKVSSNEGYSKVRKKFGHSTMKKMMKYCGISSKEMKWNRNYPYMSSKTLAKLWIGTYWYFYKDTNKNSKWARGLYKHPLNSFIDKGLSTPTRTKPGWYPGGGYNVQNDAGIVLVNGHPYVLAVMSSACGQYKKLSKLVKAIDAVHTDMIKQA